MISLIATDPAQETKVDMELFDDANRPTPLFVVLAAMEIGFDILVGYCAYRFFKGHLR